MGSLRNSQGLILLIFYFCSVCPTYALYIPTPMIPLAFLLPLSNPCVHLSLTSQKTFHSGLAHRSSRNPLYSHQNNRQKNRNLEPKHFTKAEHYKQAPSGVLLFCFKGGDATELLFKISNPG